MSGRLRALLLAVPLVVGAGIVAVQANGSVGAAAVALPIPVPAKVGYGTIAAAPAMRLWSQCVATANVARRAVSAAPLQLDMKEAMVAASHSGYQAQMQTMSHNGSGGSNAGNRLTAAGYAWSTWGENVAAGQANCESVLSVWLASPPHRANILNPAFRHIGIGMVLGANGVPYWTMDLAAGG